MQLQLYALPISGRFQGEMSSLPSEMPPSRLNCLLQANGLPQGQRLEVQVNDTLKCWQQGPNQVFAWELQEPGETIHIHLRDDTNERASWQGFWKGNAIFHLGALPVRVFFNGVEQPLVEASALLPIVDAAHDPFPRNGSVAMPTLLPHPASREAPIALEEPTGARLSDAPEAEDRGVQQEREEERDENEEYDNAEEVEEESDDEYDEVEGEMQEVEEESEREEEQPREAALGEEEVSLGLSTAESADVSTPKPEDVALGNVAVFYADPREAGQTLERLKAVLHMMPKKTVLIDLREPSRTRQKEEDQPLSRTHLRAEFGGRYWDRSQSITTTLRSVSDAGRAMGGRWERRVSESNHPDGLPFLEKYVRAGYSMLFMDAIARYEESTRRAVVIALQERMLDLEDVTRPS